MTGLIAYLAFENMYTTTKGNGLNDVATMAAMFYRKHPIANLFQNSGHVLARKGTFSSEIFAAKSGTQITID